MEVSFYSNFGRDLGSRSYMYLDLKKHILEPVPMNAKTVKLLKKFATLKGISDKQIKREWLGKSPVEKDKKKQEILKELTKA